MNIPLARWVVAGVGVVFAVGHQRRAILATVLAVLGVAAIFASCAGDGMAPSEITLEDVGRFHNEGLAHVFVRLTNAEREVSGLSAEQLNQVVNDGIREF